MFRFIFILSFALYTFQRNNLELECFRHGFLSLEAIGSFYSGVTLANISTSGVFECGLFCLHHQRCTSFNLLRNVQFKQGICNLLSDVKIDKKKLVYRKDSLFYRWVDVPNIQPSYGCHPVNPCFPCKCNENGADGGYNCSCVTGKRNRPSVFLPMTQVYCGNSLLFAAGDDGSGSKVITLKKNQVRREQGSGRIQIRTSGEKLPLGTFPDLDGAMDLASFTFTCWFKDLSTNPWPDYIKNDMFSPGIKIRGGRQYVTTFYYPMRPYSTFQVYADIGAHNLKSWIHYGLTYTRKSNRVQVYINGTFSKSANGLYSEFYPEIVTSKLEFLGDLEVSEFAIWNKVLSPLEMEEIFKNNKVLQ